MSLYLRAWCFTAWTLLLILTFPGWTAWLQPVFSRAAGWVFLGLVVIHGMVMLLLFRCPDCDLSPFVGSKGLFARKGPWPRRICGHCGRDHRRVDPGGVE